MKKTVLALIVLLLTLNSLFAEDMPPKREFRAVWLSTVVNIDWPKSRYDSDSKKQSDLKNYLVKLKDSGCNAVLMQVRCACDAMYKSDIEPWSYWFSGTQGSGPSTDWDPLTFAVEEAHKLGMELHAWVNPYRAVVSPSSINNSGYIASSHVTKQHPEWILKFSTVHILDPGLPEVRDYISDVLMDIVTRYDIDGLHMDDYFYPYSGITTEDTATFSYDPRGFEDIHDWRRDNINTLVEGIMDSINIVKPWVKWGISPFGIYKPGVPEGISGMNAYSVLYCDPIAWLANQTVDYITPQCYWPFGGGQDYGKLIPWWAEQANYYGRHFYPGQGMYNAWRDNWPRGEIPRQIRLNRATDHCDGSVFFTANDFYDNHKNTIDSLKLDLYRYPALWPVMSWKDSIPPASPQNALMAVAGDGSKTITWDAPTYTDPGDSAYAYVVYRSPYPVDDMSDMSGAQDIQFHHDHIFEDDASGMYYYGVSTLDRYKLESPVAVLDHPFVDPLFPEYAETSAPKDPSIKWADKAGASQFTLEISSSNDFTTPMHQFTLNDTVKNIALNYQTSYYWRVKADNTVYWSPTWVFTTILAPQVQPLTPFANIEGTRLDPVLSWGSFEDATSYEVQVAHNEAMSDLLLNELSISDTSLQLNDLDYATNYYWRLRSNKYDRWTDVFSFKTKEEFVETQWARSSLNQKYPAFLDSSLQASGLALGRFNDKDILLVLQSQNDSIKVNALDAQTGDEVPFVLNMTGISGGLHALRDIEITPDGVIYASNCVEETGSFKVYQWLDPSQAPLCVYQADDVAFRLGDQLTVDGNYYDGTVSIYALSSSYYKLIKLNWNNVSQAFEAEQISLGRMLKSNASLALIPGSNGLYVNSIGYSVVHFNDQGRTIGIMGDNPSLATKASAIEGFAYDEKEYLVSYSYVSETATVIDVIDGVADALFAGSTYKLGMNQNVGAVGDVEVLDNGDGTFNIFVLGNQNGLASFTFDAASAMVAVDDVSQAVDFRLGNNYPNPFNPITTIPYDLARDTYIEIKVHDIHGRLVSTLYDGYQFAGSHEVRFDAGNLSSGMYVCTLQAGDKKVARKLTLIK